MICSQDRWNQVFRHFNDDERIEIFSHKRCQTRSTFVIDDEELSPRLASKLRFHFEEQKKRAKA